MKQKRTIAGIWWLPESPDERSMGDLKLAPDKSPELKLTVESSSSLKEARYPNVLHGCNQHGKPITLFHLGRHNASLSSAITKLRYSAGYALLGVRLASRNELRAGVLRFHMQHLFEWVARSAFQDQTVGWTEGTIKYVCPEPVSAAAGSDLTLKIVSTSGAWSKLRNRGVSEDAYVEFSSEAKFDFNWCEELVTAFRHLLHFASLETVYPTRITCSKFDDPKALGGQEAEIVSGAYREEIESEFQSAWWVFQLPDVQADFGSFLGNWLATVKKYEEALGCYFTTVYFSLPDSVQHICLTQALIAFHGIKKAIFGIVRVREANRAACRHLRQSHARFVQQHRGLCEIGCGDEALQHALQSNGFGERCFVGNTTLPPERKAKGSFPDVHSGRDGDLAREICTSGTPVCHARHGVQLTPLISMLINRYKILSHNAL